MSELGAEWALEWMKRTRERVGEQRERLIDLDRQIGDGDHGENLDRGFGAVVDALGAQDPQTVADVLKLVAKTLMSTVGGAAGPLYGTAFLRGAKAAGAGGLDGAGAAGVVEAALGGIQARGKAVEGEKTMVDAWSPAARAARCWAEVPELTATQWAPPTTWAENSSSKAATCGPWTTMPPARTASTAARSSAPISGLAAGMNSRDISR